MIEILQTLGNLLQCLCVPETMTIPIMKTLLLSTLSKDFRSHIWIPRSSQLTVWKEKVDKAKSSFPR